MKYLFGPGNLKIVETLASSQTVYGFDFDGTLAPLVKNPSDARMSAETEKLMEKLNSLVPVAIITGRSLQDIASRLSFKPKYLIGNHGIEGGALGQEDLEKCKQICQSHYHHLVENLGQELNRHAVKIEDKTYSLTLHFRDSPNNVEVQDFFFNKLSILSNAIIMKGKMIINILPEKRICKGEAYLKILLKECAESSFYIGDDDTDEDVFRNKQPTMIGVKVGKSEGSNADFYIKEQHQINHLLNHLILSLTTEIIRPSNFEK